MTDPQCLLGEALSQVFKGVLTHLMLPFTLQARYFCDSRFVDDESVVQVVSYLPGPWEGSSGAKGTQRCPPWELLFSLLRLYGTGKHRQVCSSIHVLFPRRSDWVTSYKVMVSNDSHTWVTVKNSSGDMVSVFLPVTSGPGCAGLCRERQCVPSAYLQPDVCGFCVNSNQPQSLKGNE